MTNLLQENKKRKSPRTNCTFSFCPRSDRKRNRKSNFTNWI